MEGVTRKSVENLGHLPEWKKKETVARPVIEPCSGESEILHVIVPINNYVRYKRRYELFHKFIETISSSTNIVVHIVEIAFGDRPFMVTSPGQPNNLQLRTKDEIWHKENSVNLMIQRLPRDWKYVAWLDADITFYNPDFAIETIHQLQHYGVVQMFSDVINLGPDDEVDSRYKSFCCQYLSGKQFALDGSYEFWHPGFAWAMRRETFDAIGGLIDFAILGSADHHMALCFVEMAEKSLPGNVNSAYSKKVLNYQRRCQEYLKKNIGYVKGTIIHHWHGKFKNRKYKERWSILIDNGYNPDEDVKRDWQGLYIFDTSKPKLRDDIRAYFRQRNEDSIDP